MKSEPHVYSIDDLKKDKKTFWDGVRNYQARNFMRDDMRVGDNVLFYHSNTKPPGVVGIARVVRESYPDHSAWDPESHYFDKKSTKSSPRWFMVDIEFVEKLSKMVTLDQIKGETGLEDMVLVKRGRLSVQPVKLEEYQLILRLGRGE